jgi:hypothetical protein
MTPWDAMDKARGESAKKSTLSGENYPENVRRVVVIQPWKIAPEVVLCREVQGD